MKVSELIEQLEDCDPDREVYVTSAGEFRKATGVEPDVRHERLSLEPYEEENFVWIR